VAYTGSGAKPNVTIKVGDQLLYEGVHYSVTYSKNAVGKATFTINPIGDSPYNGSQTFTFTVLPSKISAPKVTATSGGLNVSFTKASAGEKITQYQISYRVKGTSKWTTRTVSSKSGASALKGLKKGKQYDVRIRSVKTVDGTKYFGAWSKISKSAKVK
jgi:hypothetical protein